MRTVLVVRSIGDEAAVWAAVPNHDGDAFASVFDINPSAMGHEFSGTPPGTINPLDEPTSTPLPRNTATEVDPRLRRTPDETACSIWDS